jgi:hypothetical protein
MTTAIVNSGRNKIAFVQGNSLVLNVTTFVFADVPGLDPLVPVNLTQGLPAPEHIVATLPITASGYVAENKVVYSIILGPTVGNFYFNWVGLKDADGVLIGVSTLPRQQKFATAGLTTGNTLTRNFLTQYSNAAEVTGIDVPADVWQISFMDVLDNLDAALITDMRDFFGRSVFFNDGFRIVSGVAGNYFIQAGVGYVEGLRVVQNSEASIGNALNVDVYVDVHKSGTFSGGINTANAITSPTAVPLTDFNDATGAPHFLVKIATINNAGVVTDLRTKRTVPAALIDTFATAQQGANADSALQPSQLKTHPDFIRLRLLALAGL